MAWLKHSDGIWIIIYIISYTYLSQTHDIPFSNQEDDRKGYENFDDYEYAGEFQTKKHYSAPPVYHILKPASVTSPSQWNPLKSTRRKVSLRPYPLTPSLTSGRNVLRETYFPHFNERYIPQILQDIGSNTFLDVVRKSSLEKMLGSKGPFTVFAPTDKVFEELNVKNVSEEDLRLIILQHIVPQGLRHQDLSDNQVLNTKSGNQLEVFQTPDGFMVGGSSLLSRYSDNVAHNGVIHVMKDVIFPY